MKCSECKSWELVSNFKRDGLTVLHGLCRRTNGQDYEPVEKGTKAVALGDQGVGAILYCDEDFGCVQFVPGKPGRAFSCEADTWAIWKKRED